MHTKSTLRKYLVDMRLHLNQTANELKDRILSDNFTEADKHELDVVESNLNLVNTIIQICQNRGNRY